MAESKYDFRKIEKKWQDEWEKEKVFEAKENRKKEKFYALEMYPYPSGTGLHVGHAFNQTIGDIIARFKRMQGYNVLHPMGYDSFGLPAENAAIKAGIHPKKYTDEAIRNFIKQQKMLGFSYDWSRKLQSHDPDYYKWNQWFFIKMYENGLVYRKKSLVNWCSKCNTVLANEQVVGGKCWRHEDTEVEETYLEQWFLKITEYADEILEEIDSLDWPEKVKTMQRNWIGKSEGTEIDFEIEGKRYNVFTTRPDTIYGVTFLVMSPEHPELMSFVKEDKKKDVEKFLKKVKASDDDSMEKEGVFTGSYAKHPLTGEDVPLWIGNFVVAEYGSGIVMGVPAHDERDFEFAKKYEISLKVVIQPKDKRFDAETIEEAYTDSGVLVNSDRFNGIENHDAKWHITEYLEAEGLGKKSVQYKIRDWGVSRQRYWGTPIPMIYDEEENVFPVDEKELPVELPDDVKFGEGNPLETSKKFVEFEKGGKKYRREIDTMDTFFDSSWYFLRFTDNKNSKKPFDRKKADYWMPVDFYTGGVEHAVMHLIYARFFTKVLRDLGMIDENINEPFKRLFNQGMVHGEDGQKMSKSIGNVIDPTEVVQKYGADSVRMFMVSVASPDSDYSWDTAGLESINRFLARSFNNFSKMEPSKSSEKVEHKINKTIKEVTEEIDYLKYNLIVIKIRELFDYLSGKEISKKDIEKCIKLISPFCPHFAEELWSIHNGKGLVSVSSWPEYDEGKINEKFDKQEEAVEKLISDINNVSRLLKEKGSKPKKAFVYVLPNEKELYEEDLNLINKRTTFDVEIFSVSDKNKHDPENKSAKVKPGKPGIYLE